MLTPTILAVAAVYMALWAFYFLLGVELRNRWTSLEFSKGHVDLYHNCNRYTVTSHKYKLNMYKPFHLVVVTTAFTNKVEVLNRREMSSDVSARSLLIF